MDTMHVLLLMHLVIIGIPTVVVAVLLLLTTADIRRFLKRYAEQGSMLRGILAVGYLFIFIAVMHVIEHLFEWYGYEVESLQVGAVWHGVTLLVLLVVFYNFYQYRKAIKSR